MERVKDRGGSFGPGQALIYIANDAKPAVINLHNGCCARARVYREAWEFVSAETGSGDRSGSTTPFSNHPFSFSFSLFLPLFPSSSLGRSMTRQSRKREREGGRERKKRIGYQKRTFTSAFDGISAHATRTSRAHLEEIYERRQSADEQITSSRYNARFFIGQVFTFTFSRRRFPWKGKRLFFTWRSVSFLV